MCNYTSLLIISEPTLICCGTRVEPSDSPRSLRHIHSSSKLKGVRRRLKKDTKRLFETLSRHCEERSNPEHSF